MDLNDLVFGKIRVRDILGAEPDLEVSQKMLDEEIKLLINDLKGKSLDQLNNLKESQKEIEREINSRPGAMALPQSKIKLFTEYNSRYLDFINKEINS